MSLSDHEKKAFFPLLLIPVELGDYDLNGNLIYQGYFYPTTSHTNGVILKHTYDASNRWTGTSRLSGVSWSDRTTLTFP